MNSKLRLLSITLASVLIALTLSPSFTSDASEIPPETSQILAEAASEPEAAPENPPATAQGLSDPAAVVGAEAAETLLETTSVGSVLILRIGCRNALVNNKLTYIHQNGSVPYIQDGRTMLPFRFVGQNLGAAVRWTANNKPIYFIRNGVTVSLQIGSTLIKRTENQKTATYKMDTSPVLKDGLTMVPLRALSSHLGLYVSYDETTKVVVVSEGKLSSKQKQKYFKQGKGISSQNLTPSTSDALHEVANQGAGPASQKTVKRALSLIETSKAAKDTAYRALLEEILRYCDGKQTRSRAETAIRDAAKHGIDKNLALRAFSAAYERGHKTENSVTLSFAGDCTFGHLNESRSSTGFPAVFARAGYDAYPFALVRPWFYSDDLTVINFEGTLTTSTRQANKQFRFRGPPSYAKILPAGSVETATVANNHSYDYYQVGFTDTLRHLRDQKVGVFYQDNPVVQTINGIRVVLIGDNNVTGSGFSLGAPAIKERVNAQIKKYKRSDTVLIVVMHAGVERASAPNGFQTSLYRSFIDNGADMVVGHHPHVLQGIEQYKGKYIAYSLGNFAFGGNSGAKVPDTLILRASFVMKNNDAVLERAWIVPCKITSTGTSSNNYQPMPVYGESGRAIVDKLLGYNKRLSYGATSLDYFNLYL